MCCFQSTPPAKQSCTYQPPDPSFFRSLPHQLLPWLKTRLISFFPQHPCDKNYYCVITSSQVVKHPLPTLKPPGIKFLLVKRASIEVIELHSALSTKLSCFFSQLDYCVTVAEKSTSTIYSLCV
ncbi:hypothetical protein ABZP36_003368 [Zizania latifolia]